MRSQDTTLNRWMRGVLAACVLVAPVAASGQDKGGAVKEDQLLARYQTLAGSEANAKSLVAGLRDKLLVSLTGPATPLCGPQVPPPPPPGPPKPPSLPGFSPPPPPPPPPPSTETTTFTPMTDAMGYGNVDIALSITEAELDRASMTRPTPKQLQTALMGGSVCNAAGKTIEFRGVLLLRSQGAGWGLIAKELGYSPQK
jgi:hypothetical protein